MSSAATKADNAATRAQRAAQRARLILLDLPQGGGPVRDFWPTWRGAALETPELPLERTAGGVR